MNWRRTKKVLKKLKQGRPLTAREQQLLAQFMATGVRRAGRMITQLPALIESTFKLCAERIGRLAAELKRTGVANG